MELTIGKNIRMLRQEWHLTQEELASHLGIFFQSISKWERGDGYPDITMLPALAHYFGVTVDALLGTDAEKARNLRESIAVQEQIIRYAGDCEVRGATLFNLCFSYIKNGEPDKAIEQAKKLPSLYKGRENACKILDMLRECSNDRVIESIRQKLEPRLCR